jgi:hypothetical protein
MLEPQGRRLLFDVLQPPEGHSIDFAIGTTFTLDLLALLTAPVAFTLFEADDPKKLLEGRSLALLESLRRYADRMAIFCDAGHIALPGAQFPQFEYLERMVVECQAVVPGCRFHPKIWILRYLGPDDRVTYRFACLTRNLTFDRCWDTVLTLEGAVLDRQRAIAVNHPLADFIEALPSLATRKPLRSDLAERIAQIQAEVRRVDFEAPEHVETVAFHPLGLDGARRRIPFDGVGKRMLVMSPFVTTQGLQRLVRGRDECVLVSRAETLEQAQIALPEVSQIFALNDQADTPDANEEDSSTSRGLHAKCYVIDDGWKSSIWTGSANATEQGFNGNVEFLVELSGQKSRLGIDALLASEPGHTGFADLLVPYTPPEDGIPTKVEDEQMQALDAVRRWLVRVALSATVTANPDDATLFNLRVSPTQAVPLLGPAIRLSCWPITLGMQWKRPVTADFAGITFEGLSLEALTSFFAFEATSDAGPDAVTDTFVMNATLQGAPTDRRERLLRAMIGDRHRFLQLLMCLLADEGFELSHAIQPAPASKSAANGQDQGEASSAALFESLVRSLERNPNRLDEIDRLIRDLRQQPNAEALFPPGFGQIWEPIWAARQKGR